MKKKVAILFGGCSEEHDVPKNLQEKSGNILTKKNMIPFISVFPDPANGNSVMNLLLIGMRKQHSVSFCPPTNRIKACWY